MNTPNRMDKSVIKIVRSGEDLMDELDYWLNKTPQERIAAVEYLRQQYILQNRFATKMDKTIYTISYGR